jgi:hypothetical protein
MDLWFIRPPPHVMLLMRANPLRGPTPPTCPSNGFARIKNVHKGTLRYIKMRYLSFCLLQQHQTVKIFISDTYWPLEYDIYNANKCKYKPGKLVLYRSLNCPYNQVLNKTIQRWNFWTWIWQKTQAFGSMLFTVHSTLVLKIHIKKSAKWENLSLFINGFFKTKKTRVDS